MANGLLTSPYFWSPVVQGAAGGFAGAMQRRLEEELARQQTPQDYVNLAQILPQDVSQWAYPGRSEVMVPHNVAPGITSSLVQGYLRERTPTIGASSEASTIHPLFLRDWQHAMTTGDWSAFEQGGRWADVQVPVTAISSLSLLPQRGIAAVEAFRRQVQRGQPIGEEVATWLQQQLNVPISPQATPEQLETVYGAWIRNYLDVASAPSQIAQTEARTEQIQAETARQMLENELLARFGAQERQAALTSRLLQNIQDQFGIEMAQEELSRYRQLTDPIVARAVAEAAQAQTDLRFSQETYEAMVERVNQELQRLALENQLSQAELERYQQLTPLYVRQAQEELLDMGLDRQRRELELAFARDTYADRVRQVQLDTQRLDLQIAQAETALEQARWDLAMAQRIGPYEEEQARLEVQRLEELIRNMQIERQNAEQKLNSLARLNTDDPSFAFKMYQEEMKQFREANMWVPSFLEYMDALLSGAMADVNQYVMQYHERMMALMGRPPGTEEAFNDERWQKEYQKDADSFYRQFPTFSLDRSLEFPPIGVWYYWRTKPEVERLISQPELYRIARDQFIMSWNHPQLVTVTDYLLLGVESEDPREQLETVIESLRAMNNREHQAFAEAYGISSNMVIEELQRRLRLLESR